MASLNGADTAEKKLTIAMEFGLGVAASCRRILPSFPVFFCCPDFFRDFGPLFLVQCFYYRVHPRGVSQNPFNWLLCSDCFKDF